MKAEHPMKTEHLLFEVPSTSLSTRAFTTYEQYSRPMKTEHLLFEVPSTSLPTRAFTTYERYQKYAVPLFD